jgi:hypothetical protein
VLQKDEKFLPQVVLNFIDLLSLSIEISLLNERVRVMVLSTIMALPELRYLLNSCSTWFHVGQELLVLPEHPSSYHVFSGVLDARF